MFAQIGQMVEGAGILSLHTNETFGVLGVRYFVKRQNVVFSFFQTSLPLKQPILTPNMSTKTNFTNNPQPI